MQAAAIHATWRGLPLRMVDQIFGGGRTLILAPHPDDESIGCGGLIAELCSRGRTPLVVVVTDGTGSHRGVAPLQLREIRERETRAALQELGHTDAKSLIFLRVPDTEAPRAGEAFAACVARIATLLDGCTTICAPWAHDPHGDHLAAHAMAREVAAATGVRHISYPVWGWALPPETELPQQSVRGWRLDIGASAPRKQLAIAAHRSQHGALADLDPEGFTLPAALLNLFDQPYEVYLEP